MTSTPNFQNSITVVRNVDPVLFFFPEYRENTEMPDTREHERSDLSYIRPL